MEEEMAGLQVQKKKKEEKEAKIKELKPKVSGKAQGGWQGQGGWKMRSMS